MNSIVRQLAERAVNSISDQVDFDIPDVFKEKFAELIIRECVGLINEQLQHNNPNDSLLALKIKEHFGVEE